MQRLVPVLAAAALLTTLPSGGRSRRETGGRRLAKVECDTANEEAPEHSYMTDGELEELELGGGLKLVPLVCWRAANNFRLHLPRRRPAAPQEARLLSFDHPAGGKLRKEHTIVNFDYDPDTKTLGEYNKGRGLGDCGGIGQWAWTGSDFALKAYWIKDECDGEGFDIADEW
jgi:Protein of unknown function (DUF1176)